MPELLDFSPRFIAAEASRKRICLPCGLLVESKRITRVLAALRRLLSAPGYQRPTCGAVANFLVLCISTKSRGGRESFAGICYG